MSRRRQKRRLLDLTDSMPGLFDIADEPESDSTLEGLGDDDFRRPEHLRFISFGSGSSGNCSYLGNNSGGLLIDAGVDNNFVTAELARNGIDMHTIEGILLTHDHGDHVRYAYALLRRNKHMRLFATPKAFNGILRRHSMSRRITDYHKPIYKEFPFKAAGMEITAFETSHDGTDNAGFFIDCGGIRFVVATDTGIITERADHYIRQASYLMLESNYDASMLRNGPYPAHLKARIASDTGHLDNVVSAQYMASVAATGSLRKVFLCHLSHINNTPQLALGAARNALGERGIDMAPANALPDDPRIVVRVLPRRESSPMEVLYKDSNIKIQ